jgi:valyl-tRNA synthetase
MRTALSSVTVTGPSDQLAAAEKAAEDLKASGNVVGDLVFTPTDDPEIAVAAEIAPE